MASREFRDSEGDIWTAWDTYPTRPNATSPEYREGWLAFKKSESLRTLCRLAPIPGGWEQASDEELRVYLKQANSAEIQRPV